MARKRKTTNTIFLDYVYETMRYLSYTSTVTGFAVDWLNKNPTYLTTMRNNGLEAPADVLEAILPRLQGLIGLERDYTRKLLATELASKIEVTIKHIKGE